MFRENSVTLREHFFNDTLVRALWPHYMKAELASVSNYFKELLQSPTCGGKSLEVLLSDILALSEKIQFPILKELAD